MSEAFQCHVEINNTLDRDLTVADKRLEWGIFTNGPHKIPKMLSEQAFVATGKPWLPGGTEGTVEYTIDGIPDIKLKIYFDVPMTPGTTNKVTADIIGAGYKATVKKLRGSGPTESVTIKVEES
jgi:hypothetical protein